MNKITEIDANTQIKYDKLLSKNESKKRRLLKRTLNKCTKKQIKFFNRLYVSVNKIPEDKIKHAIFQCENSIKKNKEEK